jgi:hypothetical protein
MLHCLALKVYRRFRASYCLRHQGISETSVTFCDTSRRNVRCDGHLHTCRRENLNLLSLGKQGHTHPNTVNTLLFRGFVQAALMECRGLRALGRRSSRVLSYRLTRVQVAVACWAERRQCRCFRIVQCISAAFLCLHGVRVVRR